MSSTLNKAIVNIINYRYHNLSNHETALRREELFLSYLKHFISTFDSLYYSILNEYCTNINEIKTSIDEIYPFVDAQICSATINYLNLYLDQMQSLIEYASDNIHLFVTNRNISDLKIELNVLINDMYDKLSHLINISNSNDLSKRIESIIERLHFLEILTPNIIDEFPKKDEPPEPSGKYIFVDNEELELLERLTQRLHK